MTEQQIKEIVATQVASEIKRIRRKRIILWWCTATFLPLTLWAATITKPNTFNDGDTLSASKLNENFDSLVAKANDNDARLTALENKSAQSFCVTVASGAVNNTISCPAGKKFIGMIIGGQYSWNNANTTLCPVNYSASTMPQPNLRIDDDGDATPNSVLFMTTGCNGLNSCTINSNTGASVYLGTCQ